MADEQQSQILSVDREDGELSEDDMEPMAKKSKIHWQEALVSLLATQQEQLNNLTNQLNMATGPTPSSSTSTINNSPAQVLTSTTSFRLAEFDPDSTGYVIEEWLNVATKLKEELHVGDVLMIAKAGEALKGRAHHYYCNWRPISRTWSEFNKDLIVAFPDRDTPGARAYHAAVLRSRDCESLSDYGIKKLRYIKRFYSELPWDIVLSMIEYGLDPNEGQAAIRIQKPPDERELLKLLSEFDARRRQNKPSHNPRLNNESVKTANFTKYNDNRKQVAISAFKRGCFKCGKSGHRADDCRTPNKCKNDIGNKTGSEATIQSTLPTCHHCKKIGHKEENCWFKHGKPKKVMLIKRGRHLTESPIATLVYNNKTSYFNYLIDSGADVSIISKTAALHLSAVITPMRHMLSGFGSRTVYTIGTCEVVAILPTASLKILFTVVPDDVMPETLDVIIGWDVIKRRNLLLKKGVNGLELHHDLHNISNVMTVSTVSSPIIINVSGLDESLESELKKYLQYSYKQTPDCITTGKLIIQLKDNTPVAYRPRRLAYVKREKVRQIIEGLLQEGIIRESQSEYASPIVLVQKKTGDLRLCVDFRDLNKRVVKIRYPIPLILDQIDALCDARYFTILDMKAGFHQIRISESSKHLTAFITPDGLYEYNRMPFGYVNSPAVYQKAIDKALVGLKGKKAFVYIDDVLVPSRTIEEGFQNLKEVVNALSTAGFRLNYEKCRFFVTEIEYLGVLIREGTVRPSPRKVCALTNAPIPTNVKGVRQFLGLASYFRRFIKGFSQIMASITSLLKKSESFKWSEECERARQFVIKKLTEEPVLKVFNPNLECEIHTDASALGIGAALLQKENDVTYPIAYFSRRTTECESKYHSYDLETMAIVDAVEHFRTYLYGRHFTVFTDCNSVRATAVKKYLHPRVARWWIKLQDYDFSIEYRAGSKMGHVDYLSRNPVKRVCMVKSANAQAPCKSLLDFQKADPFCKNILENPSKYKEYVVANGLITTAGANPKPFVPIAARLHTMQLYHDKSSHIGWNKGIEKMREDLYFPKMGQCLKKYIRNCRGCVLGKSHTGRRSGYWQQGEKPQDILDTWHIDHAGPLVKSQGCTQILVVVDAFSKYCSLQPLKQKNTEETIKALLLVFQKMGKPKRIVADRAAAFTSIVFRHFLDEQNVQLHHIATGMPRGNGQVERVLRTIFNLLRATLTIENEKSWVTVLAEIEDNINNTIHSTTGFAPSILHFSTNPRLKATMTFLTNSVVADHLVDAEEAVARAQANIEHNQTNKLKQFNLSRYAATLFSVGDLVAVEDSQLAGGGKLKPKYSGPYTVKTILPNERYLLGKQGKRTTVAAHEQLRRWPSNNQ